MTFKDNDGKSKNFFLLSKTFERKDIVFVRRILTEFYWGFIYIYIYTSINITVNFISQARIEKTMPKELDNKRRESVSINSKFYGIIEYIHCIQSRQKEKTKKKKISKFLFGAQLLRIFWKGVEGCLKLQ